jgi:TrmH family RNA methyltransferase
MRSDSLTHLEDITVAFVSPESPGNIGFLARTMKNFGLTRLVLVDGCPLGGQTWTYAMHAKEVVEGAKRVHWQELLDMGFDFYVGTTSRQGHDGNLPRVAIAPNDLGGALATAESTVCLLLGREGDGLTLDELKVCDVIVAIPTSPFYPSLNVSHAAAVVLYEIYRSMDHSRPRRMRKANVAEKEVLLQLVDQMIESSDLPDHRKRTSRLVFRRLVGRAFISGREAHTLVGLMKALTRHQD